MDAAGQVAELAQAGCELLPCSGQHLLGGLGVTVELALEHAQLERGGHEPLLRTVVEIAFDLTARLVRGLNEPGARGRQLHARLGALDRIRHQLGERGQPVLGIRRRWPVRLPDRRQRAPDAAADDDRATYAGADTELAHQRRDDSADLLEVLDPDRSRGLQHLPQDAATFLDGRAMPDRQRRRRTVGPARDDLRPLRARHPQQRSPLRIEQEPGLAGDRREDLVGRRLARHQHGHTPQGRVLARQLLERPAGGGDLHGATLTGSRKV